MLKLLYNLAFNFQRSFKPTYIIDEFTHLKDITELHPNIKYIVFDKDDTLVPLHEFEIKDKQILQTVQQFSQKTIKMIIVSNSLKETTKNLPEDMCVNKIPILLTKKKKPFNGQQILNYFSNGPAIKVQERSQNKNSEPSPSQIAIVGDRLLTDVHLGKLMGWTSILIRPIESTSVSKHGFGVFLMRQFENFLIWWKKYPTFKI